MEDKLSQFRKKYRDRYGRAAAYTNNGFKHIAFAKEDGYALGDAVRHTWDEANLIWSEKLPSGSTAIIIIQHGLIFEDKVLAPGSDDPALWASLLMNTEDDFIVRHYGEVPDALARMKGKERVKFVHSENSLLDDVKPDPRFRLVPIAEAFVAQGSPALLFVALGIALVALVGFGIFALTAKEKKTEEVVDNFLGYRNQLATASASAMLIETTRALETLMFIPGWNLQKCVLAGVLLDCEMNPTQSSQTDQLHTISESLDRNYSVSYSQGIATVSVELQPGQSYRPYLIVNALKVFERFRNQLNEQASPDAIVAKGAESHQFWTSHSINVTKKGTHLHALITLASAASSKPIFLDRLAVVRSGIGFEIDADFKILGAM